MATSTRPKGPRRRARMPMEKRAKTTARKMVKALGELDVQAEEVGLGDGDRAVEAEDGRPGEEHVVHRRGERHRRQREVQPAQPQGGQRDDAAEGRRPARPRRAGRPPAPPSPTRTMAKAPRPASVIWQPRSCPPQPVNGTSDSMTSPSARPVPRRKTFATERKPVASTTPPTSSTPPTRTSAGSPAPAPPGRSTGRRAPGRPAGRAAPRRAPRRGSTAAAPASPSSPRSPGARHVADGVGLEAGRAHRAGEGQRQAAQASDHRRRVGVDDEQRHGSRELQGRRDEDPGQCRQ